MDQEQSWLQVKDEDSPAETYRWFMRPEPRDNLGPIYEIDDELTGRRIKCRDLSIGMVRNAKEENKLKVRAFLDPMPHTRIDKAKDLQGWYQAKDNIDPVTGKAHRPRPCFTEAILTSPYSGYCSVGCHFCYVNSGMRGYRGSGLVVVPVNYGEQIAKQLTKIRRAAAGYFSSFTDPFLPLEDWYHNTENAAREFVAVGLPVFFLSRLRYPDWAVDLLTENPHSYAQKSINTSDPDDWRLLSPGALPLEEHFQDIARLHERGIYVSIQCNPVLPGVTSNAQILQLFKKLREAGADHVIVKFVEAGYSWAPTMVEKTIKRFGDRGREFEKLFTDNIGGQKTVQEEYRLKAHELYRRYATQIGLTYSTCYEYKYERDSKGAIVDKTGVSIGREFATSAQCHGHRVPMYSRSGPNSMFEPLEECPPSGCLHCADENDGKPRCGDELAGQAKALRLVDLKVPFQNGR